MPWTLNTAVPDKALRYLGATLLTLNDTNASGLKAGSTNLAPELFMPLL